jgi:hypothetical protein
VLEADCPKIGALVTGSVGFANLIDGRLSLADAFDAPMAFTGGLLVKGPCFGAFSETTGVDPNISFALLPKRGACVAPFDLKND